MLTPVAALRKIQSNRNRGRAIVAVLTTIVASTVCGLQAASAADERAGQGAVVQNVRTERMGASVLRVVYDLFGADPAASVEVVVEASVDGGRTYGVKPKSVMGDVGRGVKPGLAKSILWDVRKDLGEVKFDLIRAKISLVNARAAGAAPPAPAFVVPPPVAAEPVAPPPPARGTIVVTSQPADANVTIDGTWRGVTPSEIRELAGVHRVLVTKPGYLDNSRTVDVRAGASEKVDVTLTPVAPPPPPPVAAAPAPAPAPTPAKNSAAPQPKKKGGALKWILIGAGVATVGGVVLATGVLTPNKAPVAGSVTVSPTGTGVRSATAFAFTATGASDPDGDPLTYTWDFGDSGNGTGATATHVFATTGSFAVTLTVSDGKKSATASGSVTVKDLTGTWVGTTCGGVVSIRFTLTQSAASISGTSLDPWGTGSVTGSVSNPRNVSFTTIQAPYSNGNWTGTVSSDANTMTGTTDWYGGCSSNSFTVTRQ